MSRPGGSGNVTSTSHLTTRQWLQQRLPYHVTDFGRTPSRRMKLPSGAYVSYWDGVPREVDDFVGQVEDSTHTHLPLPEALFTFTEESEASASLAFASALRLVCSVLGHSLTLQADAPASSPGLDVGADQQAVILAASPAQRADYAVSVNGKRVLVVEMKRPAVFRTNVASAIPHLHALGDGVCGPNPRLEDIVRFEPVLQLYKYMNNMNLKHGILSSFDLTYVAHRQGVFGETLFLSEGIPCTSPRFLGVLAYMLQKGIDEPGDFMRPVPKAISPTTALGSLKSQGSKGDNKGTEKGESGKRQMGGMRMGMRTRSQGPVCDGLLETPAELLHLARHHFATGWSGKIVRGTYEGQSIVVKLAPIGSDRAKALLTEVAAYHMLKEFWGKYVPKLVSYGTTVEGTIVYIATEEINGYEIGMVPLSQEVVEEVFHALAAVHQCGILHGDIRDSNILVVKGQRAGVRLLDFGFARFDTSDEDRLREYAQLESLVSGFPCLDVDVTSQSQVGTNSGGLVKCTVLC